MAIRRISAIYMMFVGVMIIFLWTFLLSTGNVPELDAARLEISFHIAAEVLMAIILLVSGLALLKAARWSIPLSYISLGTLLYSIINSSGYYAQLGQSPFLIMFGVLLICTIAAMVLIYAGSRQPSFTRD